MKYVPVCSKNHLCAPLLRGSPHSRATNLHLHCLLKPPFESIRNWAYLYFAAIAAVGVSLFAGTRVCVLALKYYGRSAALHSPFFFFICLFFLFIFFFSASNGSPPPITAPLTPGFQTAALGPSPRNEREGERVRERHISKDGFCSPGEMHHQCGSSEEETSSLELPRQPHRSCLVCTLPILLK